MMEGCMGPVQLRFATFCAARSSSSSGRGYADAHVHAQRGAHVARSILHCCAEASGALKVVSKKRAHACCRAYGLARAWGWANAHAAKRTWLGMALHLKTRIMAGSSRMVTAVTTPPCC